MQAQFAALTRSRRRRHHHETIFENRFMHMLEIAPHGRGDPLEGNTAIIKASRS